MAQTSPELNFSRPPRDPFAVFAHWVRSAQTQEPNDPLAASLSTVDSTGAPNWRMVLIKTWPTTQAQADQGFTFFTNINSAKAKELKRPKASLGWHWKSLRRQIRIRGRVRRLRAVLADTYFATRSRDSQLAAWASRQSSVMKMEAQLGETMVQLREKFANRPIPRPDFWVGYALIARRIEFWQDGPHRLHQRLLYKKGLKGWTHQRLFP